MIEKLKGFLFEPEETPDSRRESRQRIRLGESDTENKNKWGYVLIFVFIPITLLIIWLALKTNLEIPLNPVSLCPNEQHNIIGTTYILIDFSEPLSKRQRNELRTLIVKTSASLQKHERLSISRMEPDRKNTRVSLHDFCNPADLENIKKAVGRSIDPKRDCPAIVKKEFPFPKRVGEATSKLIHNICKNLDDLDKKVEDVIRMIPPINFEEPRSYIIGSIEDVMTDANDSPSGTRRLVVFSDMLQHADWFSQYEKRHGAWTMDNIEQRRKKYAPNHMKTPPQNNFDEVLLCYQPNGHAILKSARNKNAHRAMWKGYFKGSKFFHVNLGGCPGTIANMMKK